MYDFQRELVLQGVVRSFDWADPHVYVSIETQDAAGETSVIAIEGPTLRALTIAGWSKDSLKPGDRVVVAANPSRTASENTVLGNSILIENGAFLPMGGTLLQAVLAGQRPDD